MRRPLLTPGPSPPRLPPPELFSALLTVQVGSQVSGRVAELFADWNSAVKKGQVIAKLDPLILEATVAQFRANLLSSQSKFEKKTRPRKITWKQRSTIAPRIWSSQKLCRSPTSMRPPPTTTPRERRSTPTRAIWCRCRRALNQACENKSWLRDHHFAHRRHRHLAQCGRGPGPWQRLLGRAYASS